MPLELITTDAEVSRYILDIVRTACQKKSRSISLALKTIARDIIRASIESQPAYQSLISNGPYTLPAMFGFNNGSDRISSIVDFLINSIKVNVVAGGTGGSIKMDIDIVSNIDTDDLMRLRVASVNIDGGKIPWLEWLLTRGTDILIAAYDVVYGSFPDSRSGNAVMMSNTGSFNIPPEFAGTPSDNFLTRAIEESIPKITIEMEALIPRILNA